MSFIVFTFFLIDLLLFDQQIVGLDKVHRFPSFDDKCENEVFDRCDVVITFACYFDLPNISIVETLVVVEIV